MAKLVRITGLKAMSMRLTKHEAVLGSAFARGLKAAGLHLQRESQLIVPVDLTNLKPSADTRATGIGLETVVEIGYFGVEYAIYVHEDLDARHKPGQQAKYLEQPARSFAVRSAMNKIVVLHTKSI